MECWQGSSVKLQKSMPDFQTFLDSHVKLVGVRANFVVNQSGKLVGSDGRSKSISNDLDRQRLIRLRQLADIIITDNRTAVVEEYRPSKYAPIEVWSRQGNFPSVADGLQRKQVQDPNVTIEEYVKLAVLLEAGQGLTKALAQSKSIDELALTVTGAESAEDAQVIAQRTRDSLGLSYLVKCRIFTTDGTSFFTFVG